MFLAIIHERDFLSKTSPLPPPLPRLLACLRVCWWQCVKSVRGSVSREMETTSIYQNKKQGFFFAGISRKILFLFFPFWKLGQVRHDQEPLKSGLRINFASVNAAPLFETVLFLITVSKWRKRERVAKSNLGSVAVALCFETAWFFFFFFTNLKKASDDFLLLVLGRDTRPHYIRCIKPNDNAEPDEVSRVRVMEQLRYGGVLEAVRVARSGYPVRLPHKVIFF